MPDASPWPSGAPSPLLPPILIGSTPLYFSGEDGLQLSVLNSAAGVTLRVAGRFLPAESTHVAIFSRDFKPSTDRTQTWWWIPLGQGWLLDVSVMVVGGNPQHGQCWTRLAIVRGGPTAGLEPSQLTQGYVTQHRFIGRPLGTIEAPLNGPGALRSITGTTPAAGAEITETVPTGARWELLTFIANLATSAVVANRVVQLQIDDGANLLVRSGATATQAASLTYRRSWFRGPVSLTIDSSSTFTIPLPHACYLAAGFRIRTSTSAIDAGDQYSLVQYLVREWILGE